jgi:uncharacterized coiled-coil DUF342 family protein
MAVTHSVPYLTEAFQRRVMERCKRYQEKNKMWLFIIVGIFILLGIIIFTSSETEIEKEKRLKREEEMAESRAFSAYEAHLFELHKTEANRQFNTLDLEQEIKNVMSSPLDKMRTYYIDPIEKLRFTINQEQKELAEHCKNINILSRSYKNELEPLYQELTNIKEEINSLFAEKSDAHEELKEASDDVDSWYSESSRSGWLFGNGGNKIPDHSFFGQSFGDLDDYKYNRDNAYEKIKSLGYSIDCAKDKKAQLGHRIGQIKADRQQMFDLKKNGLTLHNLNKIVATIEENRRTLTDEINKKERERMAYLENERHRNGVVSREADIARIVSQRNAFIESFHSPDAQKARRASFRVN